MALIDTRTFNIYAQVSVPEVESRSFECDELIAPVIELLNKKGYKTKFCCAGHPYPHYEEMYLFVYEDTQETISSTQGDFTLTPEFKERSVIFELVSPENIPEEHNFDDIEIDEKRPYSFYYVETNKEIYGSEAYISFEDACLELDSVPEGWSLATEECFDESFEEYSHPTRGNYISHFFPFDQDVYYFYTQQVAEFMKLRNWAQSLPVINT